MSDIKTIGDWFDRLFPKESKELRQIEKKFNKTKKINNRDFRRLCFLMEHKFMVMEMLEEQQKVFKKVAKSWSEGKSAVAQLHRAAK